MKYIQFFSILILLGISLECLSAQGKRLTPLDPTIQLRKQHLSELDSIKASSDRLNNLISTGNASVANQLSANAVLMGCVGLGITIFLAAAAIYFNRIEKRVSNMLERINFHSALIIQAESNVKAIKLEIDSQTWKLYKKLQAQELLDIISHLKREPKAFNYYDNKLYSMSIDDKYFEVFFSLKDQMRLVRGSDGNTPQAYVGFLWTKFPILMLNIPEFIPISGKHSWEEIAQQIYEYILKNNGEILHREHKLSIFRSLVDDKERLIKFRECLTETDVKTIIEDLKKLHPSSDVTRRIKVFEEIL